MKNQNDQSDDGLLKSWYQYTSQQDGFVGSFLKLLRDKQKKTIKQQQNDLGAGDGDFLRLQGMPLPRPTQFVNDTRRIAEECNLSKPNILVQDLLLARSLARQSNSQTNGNFADTRVLRQSYQAAFDEDDDIDTLPEEH